MADQSENAPEAPETPAAPITIRERLETLLQRPWYNPDLFTSDSGLMQVYVTSLQGLLLLRIAEALERLETYLRPPNTGPWAECR